MRYNKQQQTNENYLDYKKRVAIRLGLQDCKFTKMKKFIIKDGFVILKSRMNYE